MTQPDDRLAQIAQAVGALTGQATDTERAVTVEVAAGGALRSVRIEQKALRYGASYLAETVLSTAAKATAQVNHRAHQLYQQALGGRGDKLADDLGFGYDPALVGDQQEQRPRTQARTRPAPVAADADYDADYPETWLR